MNFLYSLLDFLQAEMEAPVSYGLWHICFLVLTAAVSVLLVWRLRDASDKTLRRLLLGVWILMAVSEIYKQVVYSVTLSEGTMDWSYQWYAFPFQFCSTPLYVLPFAVFLKDGRARDAVMTFLATFSLFGGLAVMLYPGDVFIGMIGINVQTMLHHGAQVAVGVLVAACYRKRWSWKRLGGGVAVFALLVAAAMLLNLGVHALLVANGLGDHIFNMFFISPYHECTLPVLSAVDDLVPYPVFLAIYLTGFSLIAAVILAAEKGIIALAGRRRAHGGNG